MPKNPADLTKRNNDARKKEIAAVMARVKRIEQWLMLPPNHRRQFKV